MKRRDQKQIVKEKVYFAYTFTSQLISEEKSGQEPGGRTGAEAMEECCSLPCSSCFFIDPDHQPRAAPTYPGLGPPSSIRLKNALQAFLQLRVFWRHFLSVVLS